MTFDEACRRIRAKGWVIRTCDDLAWAIRRILDEARAARPVGERAK
jgi:hypothetical protein